MKRSFISVVLLLAAAVAASGQDETSAKRSVIDVPSATAPAPQPLDINIKATETVTHQPPVEDAGLAEELQDVRWMLGTWSFRERVEGASSNDESDLGTITGRLGPGGRSIILDTSVTKGPNAGAQTHEVIVWSATDREFEIYTFDSKSVRPAIARGSLDHGTFTFMRKAESGGKTISIESRFEGISRRGYVRTTESQTEGQRSPMVVRMTARKDS